EFGVLGASPVFPEPRVGVADAFRGLDEGEDEVGLVRDLLPVDFALVLAAADARDEVFRGGQERSSLLLGRPCRWKGWPGPGRAGPTNHIKMRRSGRTRPDRNSFGPMLRTAPTETRIHGLDQSRRRRRDPGVPDRRPRWA